MADDLKITVSPEIIRPIVNAKIQEAILEAMGGKDNLIEKVVKQVFTQKVNSNGGVSSYSSENTFTWLDVTVSNVIKEEVKKVMAEILETKKDEIRSVMLKELSTKKGIESIAKSMIEGHTSAISNKYRYSLNVILSELKDRD